MIHPPPRSTLFPYTTSSYLQHIIKKLNIKPNQKVLDIGCGWGWLDIDIVRWEEQTSELQLRDWISYAVFCLKKKKK